MREISWIEREGGGPVRDRVRIDTQLSSRGGWTGSSSSSSSDRHTIIEPGGVDRFEFEFEFGSTHNYRAGGGGPVRVRVRVRIDTQLSSRGGWTGSSSSSDRHTIIEPGGVNQFEFEFGSTHNYRAGAGGPVRVRVRVRIDTQLSSRGGWTGSSSSSDRHTIIEPGGVDRFEFEFEFGSTHNYRAGGGGPVRVRVRVRIGD